MLSPAPPYNSAISQRNPSAIISDFHFLFYILHFRSSPALSSPLLHLASEQFLGKFNFLARVGTYFNQKAF